MIRKSITTGILVGLLLTLAALYPAFAILVSPIARGTHGLMEFPLSDVRLPGNLELPIALLLLMACAGLATLLYLTLGSVAAWRAKASGFKPGMIAGMISGAVAGLTFHVTLVSPTAAIIAGELLLTTELPAGTGEFPAGLVLPFARRVMMGDVSYLVVSLLIGLIVGGVEGGIVGWLRRNRPGPPRPASLLEALNSPNGRRAWFAACADEVLAVGLVTGLVGGLVVGFTYFWSLATSLTWDPYEQWLYRLLRQAMEGAEWSQLSSQAAAAWLTPLATIVALGMGGVAALLPPNPPSRVGARVYAAAMSGAAAGVIIALPIIDALLFNIGVLPQILLPEIAARGAQMSSLERALFNGLSSPPARVLLMYVGPLCLMIAVSSGYMVWGTLQGAFYAGILSLFRLRPVDRARAVREDLAGHDDLFLVRLYQLFQSDRQALLVLEHLAFDLKPDLSKARILAAYHTLAAQPARALESFDVMAQALAERPGWRLRGEMSALHSAMAQGLRAMTVAQIAAIVPLPESQTMTLPPLLAKAGTHLTRIVSELKKIERVDDNNSKLIFLNNALENLRLAQLFEQEGVRSDSTIATPFPELTVMGVLISQWEALILSAIKEVQGRAELTCELITRKLTLAPKLELTIQLANRGLNVAQQIRLRVSESDEFDLLEGASQAMDLLPPGESRQLAFTIRPKGTGRLRVSWSIAYDDALNDDRAIEFGDQVEFVEAEKPFQRIFPIPYVTGTPLQTGHTFVGRQDVFDFVREHLLGAYQNNVIVLHGQRRTGKTSILYRLGDVLAQTHLCVLIDMQGKAARGEADWLYSIADDIVYTLENKGVPVALPPRQEFEGSPEFFFRNRFLRGVYDALGDRNLLLMFDEFEELQKRVQDGRLSADIFPYLRNLMQHERKLDFVFAGTHKLEELAAEYWSILFNIAAYKRISFLAPDEVTRLVTEPVTPFGLEYDPLAIERVFQVAAGHPYFTQLICHEMVAYHNESRRSYLTTTDVDAVLGRIIEQGEAHFKYIWAESGAQRRLTLLALAELLETQDAVTLGDVAEQLARRGRPLDER